MKLSPEQEQHIYDLVHEQDMTLDLLRDDLIDHLCCVVENNLHKGLPFEEVLNQAIQDIAPNGFGDLNRKTLYLINHKQIRTMKKALYVVGLISSISLSIGVTFKLMQWPGANIMFVTGYIGLMFIFLPLISYERYKLCLGKTNKTKARIILAGASAIIAGFAGLFKIFHLQGGSVLMIIAALVFAFGFLPLYFQELYRRSAQ